MRTVLAKIGGAAVGEVVAVDGGEHEIRPAQIAHGFGDALGFEPVDFAARAARLDVAEVAAARARVAEDHDRGGAGAPALADVRAHRLLADRVQVEGFHVALEPLVVFAVRQPHFEPGWLGLTRLRLGQIDHAATVSRSNATPKRVPKSSSNAREASAKPTSRPVSCESDVTPRPARPHGAIKRS
jgi:hypothetical protein